MQVKDMEMYHFHNNKVYNELWVPGNEIIVDDNFDASYLNVLKYFHTFVLTKDGGKDAFNNIIDYYLTKEQDKETLIELLKEASNIICGMNIFMRELSLEETRRQKYPNLPSRNHSIWLCDTNGLDFWKDKISNYGKIPVDLYKVSVTGNLFKSSDELFPSYCSNFETNLKEAENYWNAENITEEKKVEYLFQGKLKVLEKIKSKGE